MKPISRLLALLLCLLVLAQSAPSGTVCSPGSGNREAGGMPASHHMDGHSAPTRAPQHHPCGPMSSALCQVMPGCMDVGAPAVAVRTVPPPVAHTAPQTATPRRAAQRNLAPPLTPPRA